MNLPQLKNATCLRTGNIHVYVPSAEKSWGNAALRSSCWNILGGIIMQCISTGQLLLQFEPLVKLW